MLLVAALDDVKSRRVRRETSTDGGGGGVTNTPFMGSKSVHDMPHAQLNQMDSGRYSNSHYHVNDQFQVVISGHGMLGRHTIEPYSVHFSRAYTPYGPLVSKQSLGFFVMRAHGDPGGQHLPAMQEALRKVRDRQPFQITRTVRFGACEAGAAGACVTPIPDLRDERGLAAYAVTMPPDTRALCPEQTGGEGRYIVVLEGGIRHNGRNYSSPALIFADGGERGLEIQSDERGMRGLILDFPRPLNRA